MATNATLTDAAIRRLKATGTAYRMADGQGLFLEVTPKGKKVWRFRAKKVAGTKTGAVLITLGEYPHMTLADARARREEIRGQIADGLDPRTVQKEKEQAERKRLANTFEHVTAEWLQVRADKVMEATNEATASLMRRLVFPILGEKPIADITPQDVMLVLRNAEKQSTRLPRTIKASLTRIFSYAIQIGVSNSNPAAAIVSSDVLKNHKVEHHKAISIEDLPRLMAAIDADSAGIQVKSAVRLIMMLFMRKSELRLAEWSHIDLKAARWTIPADNTKKRREQVYPLPRQAVEILKELRVYTGECKYVFSTGLRNKDAPLGQTTLNAMLNRSGFHQKMSVHGFRALASSWMDEKGYNRLAIERQLSHLEQGQTNKAYHRADYMDERRVMLQAWADYLDSVRADTTEAVESLQMAKKAA